MNTQAGVPDPAVLTCWKDIANYLGKGVRTVQRWEQSFGLPVRRPNGIDHKSAVVAYTRDLDEWLNSRWSKRKAGGSAYAGRPAANFGELIVNARELRSMHTSLIHETSMALAALIKSCRELELTKASIFIDTAPPRIATPEN
jgi:hypothetical protein